MGKIISQIHISLDGYMAGPGGEIDWIIFDAEQNDFITDLRQTAVGTLYGRVTYQIMEDFWPKILTNPDPPKQHIAYAKWVDKTLKVVVSRTLTSVSWNNTRLINDNVEKEIRRLREEVKGDLLLLGSASLVATLLPLGLIDEFRMNVNPVILGAGIGFFKQSPDKSPLKLLDIRKFDSGVVGLHYQVVG